MSSEPPVGSPIPVGVVNKNPSNDEPNQTVEVLAAQKDKIHTSEASLTELVWLTPAKMTLAASLAAVAFGLNPFLAIGAYGLSRPTRVSSPQINVDRM